MFIPAPRRSWKILRHPSLGGVRHAVEVEVLDETVKPDRDARGPVEVLVVDRLGELEEVAGKFLRVATSSSVTFSTRNSKSSNSKTSMCPPQL